MKYIALIGSPAWLICSVKVTPYQSGREPSFKNQSFSIFARFSGTATAWYPEKTFGYAPMSQAPCTLFWPRSGLTPTPGRPMLPVSIDRLPIERTLSVPVVSSVMPRQ